MQIQKRFYILDPSLCDIRGHHYELTKSITNIALKSNFDVKWITNRKFENTFEDIEVLNVFTKSMYDKNNRIPFNMFNIKTKKIVIDFMTKYLHENLVLIARKMYRFIFSKWVSDDMNANRWHGKSIAVKEYINISNIEKINKNDIIFIHTATGDTYRLVLSLLLIPEIIENSPPFHLITPYDETVMPGYKDGIEVGKVIRYLDLLGYLNKKVFIYAENKYLADHLTSIWKTQVNTLQLPATEIKLNETPEKKEFIHVIYLGAARVEKGFTLLPGIVKSILESENRNKVRFTIQCTSQIIGYSSEIRRSIRKLKKYSQPQVKLIDYSLDTEAYAYLLETSDVVLLCYDKDKYKVRSSGIATEAVSAGKTIIAREGTYPSFLAGDSCINIKNDSDIVNAINTVVNNYDKYHMIATKNAKSYRRKYSAENYLKNILNCPQPSKVKTCLDNVLNMRKPVYLNMNMQTMVQYSE